MRCNPVLVLLLVGFVMVSSACDLLLNDNHYDVDDLTIESAGLIEVSIVAPNSSQSIDTETAVSFTDVYEVVAYNPTTLSSVLVTAAGGTASILVPEGDYRVLVLAGIGGAHDHAYLLGSGVSASIAVQEGSTTSVTVTLAPVQSSLSVDGSLTVAPAETIDVTVTVDTACSVL